MAASTPPFASAGIVAKHGYRVGDLVEYAGLHHRVTGFDRGLVEIWSEPGGGVLRSIGPNALTLVERDPLTLEWMNQDNWNLGDRLPGRG